VERFSLYLFEDGRTDGRLDAPKQYPSGGNEHAGAGINICTEFQLHQWCDADIINMINQKRLHIIIMSANNK